MPLAVVPPFSVEACSGHADHSGGQRIRRRVERGGAHYGGSRQGNGTSGGAEGWTIEPKIRECRFTGPGQQDGRIQGAARRREGRHATRSARCSTPSGRDYSDGYSLVTRPDIGGFFYYQPALQRASIVDVKVPQGLKVGYIMGAGDDIPDVLRELGLDVTLLTAEEVGTAI